MTLSKEATMKLNWKSISITTGLCIVLGFVVIVEIALFISGPARSYEKQITTEESLITKEYKNIKNITRHVFYYTTYVGEEDGSLLWFNEKGKNIVSKKKNTMKIEEAKQIARDTYGAITVEVMLGYGYKNPVYVLTCDVGSILLDYDTMKEVYFLQEGDA